MLLSVDTLLEKWLALYSLPGRFPLVISKEAMLQLLSGIQVSFGYTAERAILRLTLDTCSNKVDAERPFSIRQIRQAIGYLSRASVKKRFTLDELYDPTFLDIPIPNSVNLVHLGLPYLRKQELESLYTVCKSNFDFPVTKLTVRRHWEETDRQAVMPDTFEHIWGLVDKFDTEELLPDGFFEVSWLLSMKEKGFVLPNKLCEEMRELFWEHCISMLPQLSFYKQNPSIITVMNQERAVVDELSRRLIDQLHESKTPHEEPVKQMTKPSKPTPKTKLDNNIAAALRQTLEALSGWKWKSGSPPPEITELEYEALQEGILEFSETFFKFDWNTSIENDWNRKALHSFVLLFKERVKRGDWMSKGITETSIGDHILKVLIRRKWCYLQSLYQKQKTLATGDQESKDALELEEKTRRKRARHVSRRVELYRMRVMTIEAHPEWNELWKKIIRTLDVNGMSSDETDEDISSRTFWRIPKLWRNPELTLVLEKIDSYYGLPDFRGSEISRMGNLRRKRHGDHPEIVCIEIPSELYPENFYNSIWLQNNHPEALNYLRLTWADKIEIPPLFFTAMDDSDLEEEEAGPGSSPSMYSSCRSDEAFGFT